MLNRFKLGLKNSRGDTIVEVMLVLAILGLAISISYATANRSLLDARQAQENAQATELAQQQIESLMSLSNLGNPQNIFQAGPYCISSTYTIVTGNSCNSGTIPYHIVVTGPPIPATGGTFTVQIIWPDVESQGNDTVTLIYRLYQQ
jgi:prepilin-type N-terminal cleavage/methylation domain-containing protein